MSSPKQFYLPSLDGIRAVAVMLVFVSHAGWGQIVPGGFGVTVFFFLSGYLITTLLRSEYERDGAISLRHFYLRRVYRILPPMYLVLFAILLLVAAGAVDGGQVSAAGVSAQILQMTNYYILQAKDIGIVPTTGAFWSLSVEEHFYLFFPVVFLYCVRRWPYPALARLFLAVCVLELAWRCVLVFGYDVPSNRTYLATDTRLDNLLFGCILGVWMNPALDRPPRWLQSGLAAGALLAGALSLLALTFVFQADGFRETLRYSMQGMALLPIFWLAVRHSEWPLFRWLNVKPLRLMGTVSYVFYLSHLFFLHVASRLLPNSRGGAALLGFALSVVFATLVYRTVELPFARLRRKLHEPQARPCVPGDAARAAVTEHPAA